MNKLAQQIIEINRMNGWNVLKPEDWENENKIPAKLALIHSEVSEALEAFRASDKKNFEEELADVIIRVLDCCAGLKIDIDTVIEEKLKANRKRGFKHGGKRI